MPTVLNTNVASLRAADNLLGAQEKLASSVERLSSGSRINRAKDDAAGLGVSQSLTRQINGANQGIRNLNDGISMVQTAEAAISAAMEMGQWILMLATQGANGTLGQTERTAIRDEMRQLAIAIDGIGGRTAYSGSSLLNISTATTTGNAFTLQTSEVSTDIVNLGNTAFWNVGTGSSATVATNAANVLSGKIDFSNGQMSALINAINADVTNAASATATPLFRTVISEATSYVTKLGTQRGLLGAYQNQIEYTVSNVTELSSNLTAARSRVTDTDYAAETAALTKGQILQQASTAMLAQANQMPNVILTLLK